jgi:hypothetical protein
MCPPTAPSCPLAAQSSWRDRPVQNEGFNMPRIRLPLAIGARLAVTLVRKTMRRLGIAALSAVTVLVMSAGAALAAPPTITIVDLSQFEGQSEAEWLANCGFAVDVEFEGHIIIHEFGGPRLVEVDNWRFVATYSANGKTFVALHPRAGADHFWIARDGTLHLTTVGRSPFDGMIGRIVWNLNTGTVESSHGHAIDNPLDDICAMLAP